MTTPGRLVDNSLLPGSYAFGVSVQKVLGRPAVWHGGAIDGFQSFLLYFPEPDLAVAVITNGFPATSPGNPELIARAVATAALNGQ
jgi:CubicO group peptidase (beta-lactamase class C family)